MYIYFMIATVPIKPGPPSKRSLIEGNFGFSFIMMMIKV